MKWLVGQKTIEYVQLVKNTYKVNDDWFDDVVDGKPIDAEYWQIDFIDSLLPRTALEIKGELGAPILNSRSEPRVGDQKNKQEKAN